MHRDLLGLALLLTSSGGASAFSSSSLRASGSSPPSPLIVGRRLNASPLLKVPIVDDVLDYLTNMGGYTGFTEDQLKGDRQLTEADVENFGVERATDDTVTTVFVLLLIATPFIVGAIGFSLGIFVVPSFVPK